MIGVTNNEGTSGVPEAARLLKEGRPALDAVEAGIRLSTPERSAPLSLPAAIVQIGGYAPKPTASLRYARLKH